MLSFLYFVSAAALCVICVKTANSMTTATPDLHKLSLWLLAIGASGELVYGASTKMSFSDDAFISIINIAVGIWLISDRRIHSYPGRGGGI